MTIIEIRPHRWGWKAFEGPGIEPVFQSKEEAISYETERFRSGEIRVLDAAGIIEQTLVLGGQN